MVNGTVFSGRQRQHAQLFGLRNAELHEEYLLAKEKMVVLAPMASASEITAIAVKPGLLWNWRESVAEVLKDSRHEGYLLIRYAGLAWVQGGRPGGQEATPRRFRRAARGRVR